MLEKGPLTENTCSAVTSNSQTVSRGTSQRRTFGESTEYSYYSLEARQQVSQVHSVFGPLPYSGHISACGLHNLLVLHVCPGAPATIPLLAKGRPASHSSSYCRCESGNCALRNLDPQQCEQGEGNSTTIILYCG